MSHWGKWVNDLQQNLQPVQNIVGFFINPEKKPSENIKIPPEQNDPTHTHQKYGLFIKKMLHENTQRPSTSETKKNTIQHPLQSHLDIALDIFQPGKRLLQIKREMESYMKSQPNTHDCHVSYVSGLYDSIMTIEAKRLLNEQSPIKMVGNTVTPSIFQTKNDLDTLLFKYKYLYLPYHKDAYSEGNRNQKDANWYLICSKHGNTTVNIEVLIKTHATNIFGEHSLFNKSYDLFMQRLNTYKECMLSKAGYFKKMFLQYMQHYDILMHTLMMKLLDCSYNNKLESICYSLKIYLDKFITGFNNHHSVPTALSYSLPSQADQNIRKWKEAHWITLIRLDVADVAVFRGHKKGKKKK
jgi:hypothetical protein